MTAAIGVSILGGTGYGAGELLRLLLQHPLVSVENIVSQSMAGKPVTTAHTALEGMYPKHFDAEFDFEKLKPFKHKVVFSALPHGTGAKILEGLIEAHGDELLIVDLSGDFRLKDQATHQAHYPETEFNQAIRDSFVYGLTELAREQVSRAKRIANPGCLSSACILAAAPLSKLQASFVSSIHFDAKTGTSGAGKSLKEAFHHPSRHANFEAYKVLEHRHEPEIQEGLAIAFGSVQETMFVPHLLPVSRGIFVTAYVELASDITQEKIEAAYKEFYKDSPFVRIRKTTPSLTDVIGSNFCDVSVTVRGRQVVAMSALDNLVKGMAGQAIQNMNLMCGVNETHGIWLPPLSLV